MVAVNNSGAASPMVGFIGFILVVGLIWGLPIFVTHKIGAPKRRAGWAYGLLLGWLGVVVIACLGPKRGAQHGFTNPTNVAEERADREYKIAIQRFFKEIFGT